MILNDLSQYGCTSLNYIQFIKPYFAVIAIIRFMEPKIVITNLNKYIIIRVLNVLNVSIEHGKNLEKHILEQQ